MESAATQLEIAATLILLLAREMEQAEAEVALVSPSRALNCQTTLSIGLNG